MCVSECWHEDYDQQKQIDYQLPAGIVQNLGQWVCEQGGWNQWKKATYPTTDAEIGLHSKHSDTEHHIDNSDFDDDDFGDNNE